jgi:hypothetical protein
LAGKIDGMIWGRLIVGTGGMKFANLVVISTGSNIGGSPTIASQTTATETAPDLQSNDPVEITTRLANFIPPVPTINLPQIMPSILPANLNELTGLIKSSANPTPPTHTSTSTTAPAGSDANISQNENNTVGHKSTLPITTIELSGIFLRV